MPLKNYTVWLLRLGIALGAITAVILAGRWGTRNQIDPLWSELDGLVAVDSFQYLDDAEPQLDTLFRSFQRDKRLHRKKGLDYLAEPFLPTLDFPRFDQMAQHLLAHKHILVTGVTGSGKTTRTNRLSKFVTADPSRMLHLQCVERMEVEFHHEYVGYHDLKGKFYPGKLLRFLERARQDSLHNYLFFIDDIDKIYPSTLFGPELWNELDDDQDAQFIEGYEPEIIIPPNFYMIAITHEGVGSTVPLNAEHFRRLGKGGPLDVPIDYEEMYMHVRMKDDPLVVTDSAKAVHKAFLYFFIKANELIEQRYGPSYQLGQWTDLRKMMAPEQRADCERLFIEHVNAFTPEQALTHADFAPIDYAIKHEGELLDTSPFYLFYKRLDELGLFSEITVAVLLALVSLSYGYFAFRRKRNRIRKLLSHSITVSTAYRNEKMTYDQARGALLVMYDQIRQMIVNRQLGYSEANFLMLSLNEMLKDIRSERQIEKVSKDFSAMFHQFMADDSLDESEYQMLMGFLKNLKGELAAKQYEQIEQQIKDTYRKSLAKKALPQEGK